MLRAIATKFLLLALFTPLAFAQNKIDLSKQVKGNLPIANLCSGTGASSVTFLRGDCVWTTPPGGGDVAKTGTPSSGQIAQFTASTVIQGINTVPVANGGTNLASGTSGGVLAFTGATTITSSGVLGANLPVIGGGAGSAPSTGSRQGNTTNFVTYSGSAPATNDCAKFDASGNLTTAGAACGSGGGGGAGTVTNTGTLTANALMVGNGGVDSKVLASTGTTTTVLHGNAAGLPSFSAVDLTADVTGITPSANGGTGMAFFTVSGPASTAKTFTFPNANANVLTDAALVTGAQGGTSNGFFAVTGPSASLKTFTFPNASATVLTSNAAVTVAQGGTGIASGTSGGILCYTGTTTLASSTVLSSGGIVIGSGAGTCPTTNTSLSWTSPALTIGVAGATTGLLKLTGQSSGTITLQGQSAAGTYNFNLPIDAGTSGYVLTSAAGGASPMTWSQLAPLSGGLTSGGVLWTDGTNISSSAALTANLPVIGGGAGVAPSVGTRSGNTTAFVTTTGALTNGDCVKIDASGNFVANGAACGSATPANPTATIGLAAINGVAGTVIRSDGAPALSQAIAPTWTGLHNFAITARASGVANYFLITAPTDTGLTASTEAIGVNFASATRQHATGALTTQREVVIANPTYSFVASSTITNAATVAIAGAPVAGTNATITNNYALWVQAGDIYGAGLLKAGSGPTTLTDAAGKILSAALNTVGVAQGGTGLTAGTSGGVLAYTASGTLASSAALAANAIVIGGGAGAAPSTTTTGTGIVTALGVNTGSAGAPSIIIAKGTSAMATGAISSGTCASAVTTAATGVATTDVINWGFNTDPTAITGWGASATGGLFAYVYPSSGNVNTKICNNTSGSLTPSAMTINWIVVR